MKDRVLMITRSFLPRRGGVEKHVQMICKELYERSIDIVIVSRRDPSTLKDREVMGRIGIMRYPRRVLQAWIWMLGNIRTFMTSNIVHCHDFAFLDYLPLRFLLPWKPVFQTFHGAEGYPILTRHRMFRKLFEVLSSGSICVGAFIETQYRTKCDAIVYGAASRLEFHPWTEKRRVAWVGRLASDLPVMEFARTIRILRDRFGIDLTVEIVGDGPLRRALDSFGKDNKLTFVFHGFVDDPSDHIVPADIVFAPAYLSMIESMALGRPVISIYDNPLRRDYLLPMPLSKAAILAPNAEELASTIAELYADPNRLRSIGRAGFDLVASMTWSNIADTYVALYKERGCLKG